MLTKASARSAWVVFMQNIKISKYDARCLFVAVVVVHIVIFVVVVLVIVVVVVLAADVLGGHCQALQMAAHTCKRSLRTTAFEPSYAFLKCAPHLVWLAAGCCLSARK